MLQSLDQYDTIDRWSQCSPGGELSREQAIMNDGARRMYAARVRATARARLTPWWPDSDVTLAATRAALPRSTLLALPAPPPPSSRRDWVH
jgi:hypothetical protein